MAKLEPKWNYSLHNPQKAIGSSNTADLKSWLFTNSLFNRKISDDELSVRCKSQNSNSNSKKKKKCSLEARKYCTHKLIGLHDETQQRLSIKWLLRSHEIHCQHFLPTISHGYSSLLHLSPSR